MPYIEAIPGTETAREVERFERRQAERREKMQDREYVEDLETQRHRRRLEIKQRIAAAQIAEVRHQELTAAIARCESVKEGLAGEHVQQCQPLQARLKEIEKRHIELTILTEPLDAELEEEQQRLREEIAGFNAELEEAIERENRLLRNLHEERNSLGKQLVDLTQTSRLLELGNSELVLQLKLAQRGVQFAESRRRAAEDMRPRWSPGFFAAERAAADAAVAAAQNECDEIFRRIIEE